MSNLCFFCKNEFLISPDYFLQCCPEGTNSSSEIYKILDKILTLKVSENDNFCPDCHSLLHKLTKLYHQLILLDQEFIILRGQLLDKLGHQEINPLVQDFSKRYFITKNYGNLNKVCPVESSSSSHNIKVENDALIKREFGCDYGDLDVASSILAPEVSLLVDFEKVEEKTDSKLRQRTTRTKHQKNVPTAEDQLNYTGESLEVTDILSEDSEDTQFSENVFNLKNISSQDQSQLKVRRGRPPKKENLQCPHCSNKYISRKCYQNHLKTHKNSKLKSTINKNKSKINNNKNPEIAEPDLEKIELEKEIDNPAELENENEDSLKCIFLNCGKIFKTRKQLNAHKSYAHKEDILLDCPECFKHFLNREKFRDHMRNHQVQKCKFCSKMIPKKRMINHIRIHTKDRPLKCPECDECFSFQWARKGHIAKVHAHLAKFQCKVEGCGQGFANEQFLNIHILTHSGERPFICEICARGYRVKGALQEHIDSVHKKEVYSCEICGKCYSKYQLTAHKRTVHGERKYACGSCEQSFITQSALKKHKKIHELNRIKSFICDICGNSYLDALGLKKHRYNHTGERPYKCSEPGCPKAFKDSQMLKIHKTLHGTEKNVECNFCNKKFTHKNYLKLHVQHSHKKSKSSLIPPPGEESRKDLNSATANIPGDNIIPIPISEATATTINFVFGM